MTRQTANRLIWVGAAVLVLGSAVAYRLLSFHGYADGWDPCEYVWSVEQSYLPHSPYVLYLWAGIALSSVMPTAIGLSLLSLVGGLVSVVLVGLLVRSDTRSEAGGLIAAACMAVFPVCVWESGVQEVYAFQAALVLAALAALRGPGSRRATAGGLFLGAALAAHQATILFVPALVHAAWTASGGDRDRRSRMAVTLAAALLVPAACYGWVMGLFARSGQVDWTSQWLHYLRGITPSIQLDRLSPGFVAQQAYAFVERGLLATTGTHPLTVAAIVVAVALVLMKTPRRFLPWVLWGGPYALYEIGLGLNVDRGVYLPFVAPVVAALAGLGWVAAREAFRGPRTVLATVVAFVGSMAVIVPPALASIEQARSVPSRTEFLRTDLQASFRWIREHVPRDAYVVQPEASQNVNLQPAYTGNRPIINQEGQFRIFQGQRWAPLNLSSFPPLAEQRLDELLTGGVAVVSLTPYESFLGRPPAAREWRRQTMRLDTGAEVAIYFLAVSGPARPE